MLLGALLGAGCDCVICCWGAASEVDSGIFKSSLWGRVYGWVVCECRVWLLLWSVETLLSAVVSKVHEKGVQLQFCMCVGTCSFLKSYSP